jgi:magnesium transporter
MSRLLEAMAADNRVELLRRLDPEVVESLLPLVARAERHDIRMLLSCPPNSAGSVMTTEYASLPADITVSEALDRLRVQAPNSETIYYVYVLDSERHLLGFVSLRDLVLARPQTLVGDLMQQDLVTVKVDDDQELLAQQMARYDLLAIPVIDSSRRLVGIVTHDDAIDVVVEEATEDVLRLGGVGAMDENYLDAHFTTVWRKRAMWLSCLFVAELFTFTALAQFEDAIASILALSLFVPLCISTGGNSGSQAATLITRAMALGEIRPIDWWRVLRHELAMGVALGITLGAIGFVRAVVTPQSVLGKADRWMLALVISQAVGAICLWGTLVGSMLPLLFRRLGFDPAFASSPFVATFVDVTGIVIYFSIAHVYLL